MRCRLALVLAFVITAPLLAADDKAVKDELEKLKGSWTFESNEQEGEVVGKDKLGDQRLVVTDDKYVQKAGDRTLEEGTVKVDPTKKPATIDLVITSGMDKGKTQLGIYEIKEDVLKLCVARPGTATRPTEFDGKKFIIFTMKKEKK
jgi:uncharacterized protein (TIGR03067 family)